MPDQSRKVIGVIFFQRTQAFQKSKGYPTISATSNGGCC